MAPAGQIQGATTTTSPLRPFQQEQRRGGPAAALNPEGRAGECPGAALLVVGGSTQPAASSRLAPGHPRPGAAAQGLQAEPARSGFPKLLKSYSARAENRGVGEDPVSRG